MNTSIGVYDHDTVEDATGNLVVAVTAARSSFPSVEWLLIEHPQDEWAVVGDLCRKDIIVGHFEHEKLWDDLISKSGSASVRIRTSTAGRSGQQHTICKGVFVLQLQPKHTEVNEANWKAIIEYLLTPGAAQKIVDGNIPPEVAEFFGTGNLVILPALSILCQGYRYAHKNMPGRVSEVQAKTFWSVFGDRTPAQLAKSARAEWDGLKGGGDFKRVTDLLEHIRNDIITSKFVEEADNAISSRLGANSGK